MRDDLQAFFLEPKTPRQRQYEALRAYVLEGIENVNSKTSPKLSTIEEYAKAVGFKLALDFVPQNTPKPHNNGVNDGKQLGVF